MDALNSLSTFMSGDGGKGLSSLFGMVSGGMGTVANMVAQSKRNQILQQQQDYYNKLAGLTPATEASGINALFRPLSGAITKSIGNVVSGQLAERGLGQAPGIQAEALAQGLAPFEMQQLDRATQAYFQGLGLPNQAKLGFGAPFPGQTDTTGAWRMAFGGGANDQFTQMLNQLRQYYLQRGGSSGPGAAPIGSSGSGSTGAWGSSEGDTSFFPPPSAPGSTGGLDMLSFLDPSSLGLPGMQQAPAGP